MTDKEKLEKAIKLADAMYYAAQYLTTDASKLHKAMEDYHQFIITEYNKQESASKLKWQDIQRIVKITDQMVDEDEDGRLLTMGEEDYYKEVLARYVKQSETH